MSIFSELQSIRSSRRLRDLPPVGEASFELPTGDGAWSVFAESYRRAGDELASAAIAAPWGHPGLALTMMFLYRHYIELHLKSLLRDAGELLDAPESIPTRHYLVTLWKRVRALLLKIDGRPPDSWYLRVDEIIDDFDSVDVLSFAFRFPVTTEGASSIPTPLRISPENVKRIVAELHVFFSGATTQIFEYTQIKRAMAPFDEQYE